jgi:DNA-3-methyladenine glycosylase II
LDHKFLSRLDDESVISYVTTIKGVGRWTAEMMLMFCLAREDVFPADDLGIQQAMTSLHDYRRKDKILVRNWMHKRSTDWRPFRTYACLYQWKWKDIG